jgi:hypothetical protein
MKGLIILLTFFSLFTAAALLIPTPMFPGNWFSALIGEKIREYVNILSAVFNGAFYGTILWLIFNGISKKTRRIRKWLPRLFAG